jgi:hypothetical protein
METVSRRWFLAIMGCALLFTAREAFALGADHPNDKPVTGSTNWPQGLDLLINTTNRVHGYFVNAEDIFFFAGGAPELSVFLQKYSRLNGVTGRRLILHEGTGEAKSPWGKTGRPCDWKLYMCPKGWHNTGVLLQQATNSIPEIQQAAKEPGYIVEIHFWTGGRIKLDQVTIPKEVEVRKEK